MRVGLIAQSLNHPVAGVGRYTRNLFQNLPTVAPTGWQFVTINMRQSRIDNMQNLVVPNPAFPVSETYAWYPLLRFSPRINSLNIVHNPGQVPTFFKLGERFVVTVHDLSPLVMPVAHSAARSIISKLGLGATLERADLILAISQFTANELQRVLHVPESKIRVTHLAAEEAFREIPRDVAGRVVDSYGVRTPYFLSVGTIEPRKNLGTLLEAFEMAKREGIPESLVIVGQKGWKTSTLMEDTSRERESSHIHFLGYIPDSHLTAFYNLATAFVYPSLYEGFGIPPLEAMQCGTPVIASSKSSLPEVVGDAGVLIDPQDSHSIAENLVLLSNDPEEREKFIERGRKRSRKFSWIQTAQATLESYMNVLEGR